MKAAPNGAEALRMARESHDRIDLLVTDLVMPGMSGSQLARELASERPEIRQLFISGHSEHVGLRNQALNSGASFLEKPFSLAAFGRKLREALNARPRD